MSLKTPKPSEDAFKDHKGTKTIDTGRTLGGDAPPGPTDTPSQPEKTFGDHLDGETIESGKTAQGNAPAGPENISPKEVFDEDYGEVNVVEESVTHEDKQSQPAAPPGFKDKRTEPGYKAVKGGRKLSDSELDWDAMVE